MCGFVACVSFNGEPSQATVARMLPQLLHRGPDDAGTWQSGNVGFGFRRLSIIDLTAGGHQPMLSDDGSLSVVFNGEIYNYVEIRRELQGLGHAFRSASDSEVLLRAYQQWGTSCVDRFVGMWAFLVHDVARGIIFGSRDRFGIKPLFVARPTGSVLVASEIKAILAALASHPAINWRTASRFLLHGHLDDSRESFFDGITSIPAAHSFTIDTGTGETKQWCYWKLPDHREPVTDAPSRFAQLFDDAIRLHSRSDVPLAVHLSGGLDSTSIACGLAALRQAESGEQLNAICFVDRDFDETEQIEATIAQTGARLHRLSMGPEEIWARLMHMLRAHDEPAHTMTALVSFCLMEVTRQMGVKVVLNGQGADETLAGYSSYFRPYWRELMLDGQYRRVARQVSEYAAVYGGNATRLVGRELKACLQDRLGSLAAYSAAADLKRRSQHDAWFSPELHDATGNLPGERLALALHDDLAHSIFTSPLPIYLRVEDRNSMAHSVESRVPFLDHRLVELAFSVPASELLDGHWNKHLLRRAMAGRIPEAVRTRWRKFGFPTPAQRWLRGPLAPRVRDILERLLPESADVICGKAVLDDFQRFVAGDIDCEQKLFRVIEFLLWRHEVRT